MTAARQPQNVPRDFNLRDLIRKVAEDEPDPHRIAEQIAGLLSINDVRTALLITLPAYVRITTAVSRGTRHDRGLSTDGRSRKWQDVVDRQDDIKLLRRTVFAQGTWKFMGDCDVEDCADLAHRRLQASLDNEQWAERWDRAAKALTEHKAATISDLEPELISEIFHA